MPIRFFEFVCTECRKLFDFPLNTKLDGNYRIHCPECGHIHYRVLNKGEITDKRFTNDCDDQFIVQDIKPMKHSCRDYKKQEDEKSNNIYASLIAMFHK